MVSKPSGDGFLQSSSAEKQVPPTQGKSRITSSPVKGCFNIFWDNFLSVLHLRDVQAKEKGQAKGWNPMGQWMESQGDSVNKFILITFLLFSSPTHI